MIVLLVRNDGACGDDENDDHAADVTGSDHGVVGECC